MSEYDIIILYIRYMFVDITNFNKATYAAINMSDGKLF